MTSRTIRPCSHELRPGTAVCLRCQHAERGAKRARQWQLIARGAVGALFLGVLAVGGIAAATTWKGRTSAGRQSAPRPAEPIAAPSSTVDSIATAGDAERDSAEVTATLLASTLSARSVSLPTAPTRVASTPAHGRAVAFVIPVGRTQLRDTMVAERAGDTVRVSFDLAMARTRRSDKFEAIVRSTLRQVFGTPIDSALRALPVGALARAGDLTTALTQQGFRIPLADGRTIAVWPETRPGRDGPLVVAYRAVASR